MSGKHEKLLNKFFENNLPCMSQLELCDFKTMSQLNSLSGSSDVIRKTVINVDFRCQMFSIQLLDIIEERTKIILIIKRTKTLLFRMSTLRASKENILHNLNRS